MKFYGGGAFFGSNPSQVAFFDGTNATSTLVPDTFNCALDGRPYMLDLAQPFYRQLRRQLEPLIRTQADTSNEPGEQSMDPNGLWRRSVEDWRDGAGQRYYDRNTSVDNAFWASQGIDAITTAWQISLLPTVINEGAPTVYVSMAAAGANLYTSDSAAVYYTPLSDVVPGGTFSYTMVSGLPGAVPNSMASDGASIYLACGANGVYSGTTSVTQYVTSAIDSAAVVGYANGRLMLGSTNNLYNIVASGALPTALITFGDTNARVTCFTGGNNWLYAGVNSGGSGYIYGTQTTADGTTLAPPVVQTQLPAGETVQSMCGYLGYLVIGTNLGVRVCQQGTTGVTLGTLIPTPHPVLCMAAWGSFVWFGFTNYSGSATGVGKISLENFVVQGILPAYQSDRMAAGQGNVDSVYVAPNGTVVFHVSSLGQFCDHTNLVTSGTIQSGYILYDLTDPKVPALIDVQGAAAQEYGTYEVALSIDGNSFETIGSAGPMSLITNTFQVQQGAGSRFEVLLTLLADTGTPTQGPTITRWTLRSYPAPLRPKTWQLPIMLDEKEVNASGQSGTFDPEFEVNYLEALANSGKQVIYQEGNESYLVFVTDFSFIATDTTEDKHFYNGLALVNIQSIPVPTPQIA